MIHQTVKGHARDDADDDNETVSRVASECLDETSAILLILMPKQNHVRC